VAALQRPPNQFIYEVAYNAHFLDRRSAVTLVLDRQVAEPTARKSTLAADLVQGALGSRP